MQIPFHSLFRRITKAGVITTVLLGVISYNLYFTCQLKQMELEERQAELDRLNASISLAEFANSQLQAQVAHLSTDAGAEEIAREKLGLVKQGEIAFVVLGGTSKTERPIEPKLANTAYQPGPVMQFMHWLFLG